MKKKTAVIVLLLLLLNIPAQVLGIELPKPTGNFFVNDFANVIDSESEQHIQNAAVELQNRTTAQVVVVTVDNLQGESRMSIYCPSFGKGIIHRG